MDDNSRAFARNMFRLKIHESDGKSYQDLFVAIMRHADPGFQTVRPYGNSGDRKNDGFNKRTGAYYQVYAPEDMAGNERMALTKLRADFKGLKAFWDKLYTVRRFYFAVNDKYRTVGPPLRKLIATIKKRHGLEDADILLSQDLEEKAFSLADDRIIAIVGHVPNIAADEFLFLSGFTYFMGAWMEFENAARSKVQKPGERLMAGSQLIRTLRDSKTIESADSNLLYDLNAIRNPLVHGDNKDLPDKKRIDALVTITQQLKGRGYCREVATEPRPAA